MHFFKFYSEFSHLINIYSKSHCFHLELYGDLQQLKETIEQEHVRLSQLQSLLRDDGNKVKTGHNSKAAVIRHANTSVGHLDLRTSNSV